MLADKKEIEGEVIKESEDGYRYVVKGDGICKVFLHGDLVTELSMKALAARVLYLEERLSSLLEKSQEIGEEITEALDDRYPGFLAHAREIKDGPDQR